MSGHVGRRASGQTAMILLLAASALPAQQPVVIDDFERPSGWVAAPADGVRLDLVPDSGRTGQALRLDFDFQGHGGYAVARKAVSISLPENYAFTFWIRGEAPVNNLEFKLVDSTGDNVWWRNLRNFTFSREWRKVTIRKRQIDFAWGPRGGGEASGIAAIELAITAGSGGKGRVWIDDFRLETRPPDRPYSRMPAVTASSAARDHQAHQLVDTDSATGWTSRGAGSQWVVLDFLQSREFGGLIIDWAPDEHASGYTVEFSDDGRRWSPAYRTASSNGGRDYLYLPESETRYLRLRMTAGPGARYGIRQLAVMPLEWSASPNAFFREIARDAPRGSYPRYFDSVQTWWTMVGENGDGRRSLLSQDGAFESLAGGFSVEPFICVNGGLLTWADGSSRQSLQAGYLPIPSVERVSGDLALTVTAFSAGTGDTAAAYTRYRLANQGTTPVHGTLYLAVRPFQVNPPWQFLGVPGGVSRISALEWGQGAVSINGMPRVRPTGGAFDFGAVTFAGGDIIEHLRAGRLPSATMVVDSSGYASAALSWRFALNPGEAGEVFLTFPLADQPGPELPAADPGQLLAATAAGWDSLLGRVVIDLPPGAAPVEHALQTTLAYMLINRDGPAIEPGARSYRRAWIRDGAMIGNAFLRLSHPEPVRAFIEWYAPYQYESGKVPCCVDSRGADPVPEHDSHGELIHVIAEYYRYTGDRAFLERMWPHIARAAGYIDSLRGTRRTAEYRDGPNRKYFGLMPPSISHEGYSAKPVHSYWDDFWVLRGLADAVDMAAVLGRKDELPRLRALHAEFRHDLHQSIRRTMQEAGISYIPGSADLADYDPTSTTVGLEPAGQLDSLPAEALRHTFDRYLREIQAREDSSGWDAYTPYEWRNVGAFVRLGEPDKAWRVFQILFAGRRPAAWNQWPEVVYRDSLAPRFLGDLPHTWVGSDFARSLLDMIAYVRHSDSVLVIGAGVPAEWVTEAPGLTVRGLPIGRGRLDIRMTADSVALEGSVPVPPGGILVRKPGTTEFLRVGRLPFRGGWVVGARR